MSQDAETKNPEVTNETPSVTGEKQTTGPSTSEKTFTQAEVDRLITERLGREQKKYADYDTVKAELKRLKEASQTDADRLKAQVDELTTKMTAAEAKATANLIKSSVVAAAARLDFNDPGDAYRLLDLSALEVTDDGTLKALDTALQKLLADKPYLRKQAATKVSPTNPVQPQALTMDALRAMKPEQINQRWDEVQKLLAGK